MNKADRQHLNRVAALGCIACIIDGIRETPCEVHHPRAGTGKGMRASHREAIGLCPPHHRGTMHPAVPSIHLDRLTFIERYGTEAELLQLTREELA